MSFLFYHTAPECIGTAAVYHFLCYRHLLFLFKNIIVFELLSHSLFSSPMEYFYSLWGYCTFVVPLSYGFCFLCTRIMHDFWITLSITIFHAFWCPSLKEWYPCTGINIDYLNFLKVLDTLYCLRFGIVHSYCTESPVYLRLIAWFWMARQLQWSLLSALIGWAIGSVP